MKSSEPVSDKLMSGLPLPKLPCITCRLHFVVHKEAVFTSYTGSIWRGYFGSRLRRMVCITGASRCDGCLHAEQCPYVYLFETKPPEDAERMRKYSSVPHPLVLAPPPLQGKEVYRLGSVFPLTVHLFGRACESLSLVLHVLAMAGEAGLGREGVPMRLEEIISDQASPGRQRMAYHPGMNVVIDAAEPVPPACPGLPLDITLETPLRIVNDGRFAGVNRFRFRGFFSSLLRRISMLTVFHTDYPLQTDFAGLVKLAETVRIETDNLRWREWKRHSARQKRLVPMGGLVGNFTVDLNGAEALWPYLWLGQWTHVGKGTIMGLGRYSINEIHNRSGDRVSTV